MGRITSGASRGLDKTAGRNAGSWWWRLIFKPVLVVVLLLGVINTMGGEAQAATGKADQSPRFACNTTIKWDYTDTYEPQGVDTYDIVDWAYNQVDQVADIETTQIASAAVKWEWQSVNSGATFRPGETYRTSSMFGDKWWAHGLNGDREWTQDALREHVLRAVLTDLGVTNPTSTGAGTTAEDRAELARACKRKPTQSSDNDGVGMLDGLKPSGIDTTPGVLGGLDNLDLLILLLVVGPLVVFLLAGERLAGRFGGNNAADGEPDPA